MKRNGSLIRRSLAALLAVALVLLPGLALGAQAEPPAVLILPIDRAQFLPGSKFDFRVEVHAAAMPEDFKVTINGENPNTLFGVEPKSENWTFGPQDNPTPVQSMIWRQIAAPPAGEYKVEVVAGGQTHAVNWTVRTPQPGTAKNVILFIADGMTVPMITAARVLSRGMTQGKFNGRLSFETFEAIGLSSTSSVDSIMMDSANTASAMNTGHKGSVNATGSYSDTSPDLLDDPRVETFAEMIRRTRGMAVGVVTTSDFTDATPAAVWAHGRNRSDPVRQYFAVSALDEGLKPEVIMGGGSRRMIPKSTEGSRRTDERDVFADYEKAGYKVVTTKTELEAALKENPKNLLGVFHPSDLNVWLDRNVFKENLGDFTDQPGLVDMTVAALEVLKHNPNGFYLEVEAASVDKQMHPLDVERALADLIEFERSIAAALDWAKANAPDTLIVVTADHGHGFEVYGTVDVARFNAGTNDMERRAAIRVYQNASFPTYKDENGDFFPDDWAPSVVLAATVNNHPDYTEDFQVSKKPRVPAISKQEGDRTIYVDNPDDDPNGILQPGNLGPSDSTGVHTLQDVPVYATGPGAAYFGKSFDQSEIFFGMAYAIGLDPSKPDGMAVATDRQASVATNASAGTTDATNLLLIGLSVMLGLVLGRRRTAKN